MVGHKSADGNPVPKQDARIGKSRDALRAALLELVSEHAVADITATMVVARAGVGYRTFFRHYQDIRSLLFDLAEGAVEELIAMIVPVMLANDRLGAMRLVVDYVDARRGFFRALLQGADDAVRHEVTTRVLCLVKGREPPADLTVPVDLAMIHMVGSVIATIGWWLEYGAAVERDRVAELLDRLSIEPALRR